MTERIIKDEENQERNEGLVKPYYFTFGSSEYFPYQRGHVEVQAQSREEAVRLFRSHYPDRHEGLVNCAFIYDQNGWNQMPHDSDQDCHHVISSPGPYAVMFDQDNKEKPPAARMDEKGVHGNEVTMEETYWGDQGKYQAFVDDAIKKIPQIGYTDNPDMNLFIAFNNIYYDLYNNGSCNIRDCYRDAINEHIRPIVKDFKTIRFIKEDHAYAEQIFDRVVEYLQDKSLDYQAYPVWLQHDTQSASLSEPPEGKGWDCVVAGNQEDQQDRFDHFVKQMGYRDATVDFQKTMGEQPLDQLIEEAKEKAASHAPSSRNTPPELDR